MSRPASPLSCIPWIRGAALAGLLWACSGCGKDPSISLSPEHLTLTCPDGMVLIQATSFHSGPFHAPRAVNAATTAETQLPNSPSGAIHPLATDIPLPAYCIDRYVQRDPAPPPATTPAGAGLEPAQSRSLVTYEKAAAWCQSRQMQLCTPYQWELGCRGKNLQRFPYGTQYDPTCGVTSTAPCKSSYGVYDQLGQAPEWVLSDVGQPRMGPPERHLMGGLLAGEDPADVDCLALRSNPPAAAVSIAATNTDAATAPATAEPTLTQLARVRCCTDPNSQSDYVLDYDR